MSVPKLRFKEFDEAWKPSMLADIGNIVTGSTPATSKSEYYNGDFLFVSPADIQENRYVDATKTTLTKEGFNKCRHIPKNSILFVCIGSTIGKIAQNKEICATNQQINAVIPNNDHISDFVYLVLDKLAPSIKLTAGVQAVPLINKTEFGKTELFTPTLGEQTKIASFLSAVDEKISQLTQKHQLLSQYKQGMMQKMFSQQIRFKADDGSEFGEWEEKALKTIARIYDGTHQTPNYVEDGVPFYSVEHVTANNFFKTKFIAEDVFLDELKRVQLEKNDILLTRIGDIGTSKLIDWDVRASFYVSLALIKVDKNHNSSFVNQYIKSIFFQKELHERTIHVAFPKKINLGEIGLCLIRLPCLAEQTKIANFLSAIDQKIEVVAQQIEQAKQWKKGLLQQMFV